MRSLTFAATAAAWCAGSAQAYVNTSPFLLFSTAELANPALTSQVQTSAQVLSSTESLLSTCPTAHYLLISQPSLHASDLTAKPAKLPRLRRALSSSTVRSRVSVAEVVNVSDFIDSLGASISTTCKLANLETVRLAGLGSDKDRTLAKNDEELDVVLKQYEATGDYTVVYVGGKEDEKKVEQVPQYQAEFADTAHMEIKRSVEQLGARADGGDSEAKGSLFDRYQFFTPSIFMGLLVFIILLAVLGVGISGIASLEVPYGAFDKDMGPAAQKKQQ